MQKATPFDPLYGLRLDGLATFAVYLILAVSHNQCVTNACIAMMSRVDDVLPLQGYYLASIDRGASLSEALKLNLVIWACFGVAVSLFAARIIVEMVWRRTRVAGDTRAIWMLISGLALVTFCNLFNVVDYSGHPEQRKINLVCYAALTAAGCLSRSLIQYLARLWDKAAQTTHP